MLAQIYSAFVPAPAPVPAPVPALFLDTDLDQVHASRAAQVAVIARQRRWIPLEHSYRGMFDLYYCPTDGIVYEVPLVVTKYNLTAPLFGRFVGGDVGRLLSANGLP